MASLILALTLCPPAARAAHGVADLVRLETRAEVVLVANAPQAAPGKAPASPPEGTAAAAAGETESAAPKPLSFSVRPLRGAALTTLATALLAAEGRGEPTPGVSGLFVETDAAGDLWRLWVGGAPTGPNRIFRVAVDERLLAGPLAEWLTDPALPASGPEEGPAALAWNQVEVAAATLADRRAGLGAGWIAACPRAGRLI